LSLFLNLFRQCNNFFGDCCFTCLWKFQPFPVRRFYLNADFVRANGGGGVGDYPIKILVPELLFCISPEVSVFQRKPDK
jgi:hypothetical protein